MRILVVILLISVLTVSAMADKKVAVSDHEFNFGKTVQHTTLIHDFWIKSLGDEPVRILTTIPGCGCTQIPLTDSLIPPGDSVSLRIILNTQAFRGQINKHPSFLTDIDTVPVKMKLYAEVETDPTTGYPLILNPSSLDVSQFSSRERRRGKLTITNPTKQDFKIIPIDTAGRSFSIRLPESVPAGGQADVYVLVHKDKVETEFKESVTFEVVGDNTRERYTIPVIRLYKPNMH